MKAKILIIDDEENIRFSLERFLLDAEYEVATAKDYDAALAKINETDFDLIFADIILKGKTGIDILQAVNERDLQSPVVLFTGAPNIENASEAVRLGAFDYIPKPLRQETLLRVTKSALQHKTLMDEKENYRANLEAIFKSVKDAIITVDQELSVIEANDTAGEICGIFRDAAIGKAFNSLLKGCRGKCLEIIKETIKKKQPVEARRVECHRKDRPEQVVSMTAYPLLNRRNLFSGGILVIRDETRLDNLEQNLKERQQFHNIIGKSVKMQEIYSLVKGLADVQTGVLISGETGTGKELVAEALHHQGVRRNKFLVKANCSALSEDLLESELFGHVKGAFTGAVRDKIGLFRRADGGTIFLDEIAETSPRVQLRLLRILQEMEFQRVGDSTPIKVDVRVVAATNKNLREEVRLGRFREDLYYRLKVVELNLPPLRNKREDIPLLVEHFLKKFNRKFNKKIIAISKDVQKIFMEYSWPGNVRELEHALEHAFIICNRETIVVDHLPLELKLLRYGGRQNDDYSYTILNALEQTRWNKTAAARLLGMSRQSLYRKIKTFKIMKN
jgi:PAS domain S-box-containing protein